MAFDGITVASIVKELSIITEGTRINKIAQPETDELLLTIKGNSNTFKLLISADASLPLVYKTDENKQSPLQAPGFCMLLRKHLTNAKIMSVTQPGLERIIRINLEHLDEMGDLCQKALIVEIMGKHSNIIFVDSDDNIIDSIKHISHNVSSVREVLPGRKWFIPDTQGKRNPLECGQGDFATILQNAHVTVMKVVYGSFTGISPIIATEICERAGIDADASTSSLTHDDITLLYEKFSEIMGIVSKGEFEPAVYYKDNVPVEFSPVSLSVYSDLKKINYDSISNLIEHYYREKSLVVRIRQKSIDLRRITQTALERNIKKLDLQKKQLEDTEKKDKYKVYGELINTYGYSVEDGSKSFEALNYYTNENIIIPLDGDLSVKDNAKRYFDKYNKLKRTAENLTGIIEEVSSEISHLDSIMTSLDIAVKEEDLIEIKNELTESGYIKKTSGNKKIKITSKPFHYVSSDGFDIYVGKNNYQNDWLTFEFANGNDWWFHAKKMPGSHVIIRTNGNDVPDKTFEEAAKLAAYYSKGRGNQKVEIDYTIKKNVKKPAGAKPGFVVYYTNYSMVMDSDISDLHETP